MDKDYVGAIIDACEDTISDNERVQAMQNVPEALFEGDRYDKLASKVGTILALNDLDKPGSRTRSNMDALEILEAMASSQCITAAALRAAAEILPGLTDAETCPEVAEETMVAVTATIIEWLKTEKE